MACWWFFEFRRNSSSNWLTSPRPSKKSFSAANTWFCKSFFSSYKCCSSVSIAAISVWTPSNSDPLWEREPLSFSVCSLSSCNCRWQNSNSFLMPLSLFCWRTCSICFWLYSELLLDNSSATDLKLLSFWVSCSFNSSLCSSKYSISPSKSRHLLRNCLIWVSRLAFWFSLSSLKASKLSNFPCNPIPFWISCCNACSLRWISDCLLFFLSSVTCSLSWFCSACKVSALAVNSSISFWSISKFFFRPIFLPSKAPTEPPCIEIPLCVKRPSLVRKTSPFWSLFVSLRLSTMYTLPRSCSASAWYFSSNSKTDRAEVPVFGAAAWLAVFLANLSSNKKFALPFWCLSNSCIAATASCISRTT